MFITGGDQGVNSIICFKTHSLNRKTWRWGRHRWLSGFDQYHSTGEVSEIQIWFEDNHKGTDSILQQNQQFKTPEGLARNFPPTRPHHTREFRAFPRGTGDETIVSFGVGSLWFQMALEVLECLLIFTCEDSGHSTVEGMDIVLCMDNFFLLSQPSKSH